MVCWAVVVPRTAAGANSKDDMRVRELEAHLKEDKRKSALVQSLLQEQEAQEERYRKLQQQQKEMEQKLKNMEIEKLMKEEINKAWRQKLNQKPGALLLRRHRRTSRSHPHNRFQTFLRTNNNTLDYNVA